MRVLHGQTGKSKQINSGFSDGFIITAE
jgi:hypothetical protein